MKSRKKDFISLLLYLKSSRYEGNLLKNEWWQEIVMDPDLVMTMSTDENPYVQRILLNLWQWLKNDLKVLTYHV